MPSAVRRPWCGATSVVVIGCDATWCNRRASDHGTSLAAPLKNRASSLKSEPGWKLGSIFSDLSVYGSGVTSDPGNSASDLKFDLEMNLAPQI